MQDPAMDFDDDDDYDDDDDAAAGRTTEIRVTRRAQVPDFVRLARYHRAPELGPRLLFFSGGSALRSTSRALVEYTHNSIHLITPFDSGGSSAKLRDSFPMISVGDLRNRLMALSDTRFQGHPEVYRLFSHRFPEDESDELLLQRLQHMVKGDDEMVREVPQPLREIIRSYLGFFVEKMPASFDLRGASIGNLILAGGYLNHNSDIDSVLFLFSRLVEVKGTVRPVVNANLHLRAEMTDGTELIGQHQITNKKRSGTAAIRELQLCTDLTHPHLAQANIDERTRELIASAELICFPIGSFYTSVLACLLPHGVGTAVQAAGCPKVYVPNCGRDTEAPDLSPSQAVATLIRQLRSDSGKSGPNSELVDFVLVDPEHGDYPGGPDIEGIRALGVQVIQTQLVTPESSPMIDPRRLSEALLSLV